MTEAEFNAMIDEANARITASLNKSFDKVREDIHASFQESYERLNERFNILAEELGVTLPEAPARLSEFVAAPAKYKPAFPQVRTIYDDGEFAFGYTLSP